MTVSIDRMVEELPGERDVYLYLLVGRDRCLLVDTGLDRTPATVVMPHLERAGLDPRRVTDVLVTHADTDHSGGIGAIRELLPHAAIHGHEADRELIERVDALVELRYREFRARHGVDDTPEARAWTRANARDGRLDRACVDGDRIELEPGRVVELFHTPGHSRGSVSAWDPGSRTALISDAALGVGLPTRDGTPAFPPTYRFVDDYLETLGRLERLEPELMLTGHYPPMDAGAAAAFLASSRAFLDRMDAELEQALAGAGGRTTGELIAALAPRMGDWAPPAQDLLVFPLAGHLERLERRGRVVATETGGPARWSLR